MPLTLISERIVMKAQYQAHLSIPFGGKTYNADLTSVRYTDKLIVSKILMGYTSYWVILQNRTWRFIGDMPLCREFKNVIIDKIEVFHALPPTDKIELPSRLKPSRIRILLNAILSVKTINYKRPFLIKLQDPYE